MMVFLLKSSIVLAILLGFYKLFLQKEHFFALNRIYLMACLVFAFTIPFITLPEMIENQGIVDSWVSKRETEEVVTPPVSLSEFDFKGAPSLIGQKRSHGQEPGNTTLSITFWSSAIYLFGVVVLLSGLIAQFVKLILSVHTNDNRVRGDSYILINREDDNGPYSFFKYIFINPDNYTPNTYQQILEHEKIHVRQGHSIDLLVSEIATIVLWFNPFMWLFRTQVEKNIEYQTDAILLDTTTVKPENYQLNLLEIASNGKPFPLVSNYNHSLIKKRIIMMNSKKSNRYSYWKYAFLVPTLFTMLLVLNQPFTLNAQQSGSSSFISENETGDAYDSRHYNDLPPLLQAAARGDEMAVKTLLTNGADVNIFVHGDGTALCLAIQNSHLKIAEILLRNGADPNLGSRSDGYPIMLAVAQGDIDLTRFLVHQGVEINRKFLGDGSALIQAAKDGNLKMVQALIELNADIDMPVRGDGNPLIMASKGGHLEVVTYLVKSGADVNYEVVGDEVPLINASEQGHLEVVKYLVDHDANVNKVCKEMVDGKPRIRTALKMARQNGHTEIVEYLKGKGATE